MSRFPIPDAALDSDIAILGRKGGGKTITAKGIAERLLDLKRRVLILDPLGGWAGLRTSADGKRPGYKVAIIGGEHADYPLDVALAVPLADVLARENVPTIVDLSDITKTQQQSFLLRFLHELRRVNREAMTIILEEADVFAPQNPLGDDSKALHAELDFIARRGRARGFRLVSVCQRPARLSKDVLTQAGVLIAHVLPAPQDRDAVEAWIEGNGDVSKTKEIKGTLAELKRGEAWIWSTVEGARFLTRATFPMIATLDTTATPKAGEKRIEQKTLAEVDVSAIKAALEKAKAPKKPPEAKAARGVPIDNSVYPALLDRARRDGFEAGFAAGNKHATERAAQEFDALARMIHKACNSVFETHVAQAAKRFDAVRAQLAKARPAEPRTGSIKIGSVTPPPSVRSARHEAFRVADMPSSAEKMLAILDTNPPVSRPWGSVAALAGFKGRGGYFNSGRKYLIDAGLVVEESGRVRIAAPSSAAEAPLTDPAAIVERWKRVLSGAAPRILDHLFGLNDPLAPIGKAELAFRIGIEPRGGYWNSGLSELRNNELIEVEGDFIRLRDLSPEARQ